MEKRHETQANDVRGVTMDKMTSNAKRDAAFDKELKDANRCCESCYNFTLNSRITFERGWGARDAEVAELRAQLSELKEDVRLDRVKPDDYRELVEQNKALQAQLDEQLPTLPPEEIHKTLLNHGLCVTKEEALELIEQIDSLKQQVEILKSEARLHDTIVTQLQRGHAAQLKTRDEALQVAVDAIKDCSVYGAEDKAITKINTLLGREG